jgi:hypothetical protein
MRESKAAAQFPTDLENISRNSAFLRLISLGGTFLSQLIVPVLFLRYASISELGLWFLVMSIGGFASLLDFGLIQVVTTSIIQELARGNTENAKKILSSLFSFLVMIVFLVVTIVILINGFIKFSNPGIQSNRSDLIELYFAHITIGLLVRFFEGSFRAFGSLVGMRFMVLQSYLELSILSFNLIAGESLRVAILEMIFTKTFGVVFLYLRFQTRFHMIQVQRARTILSDLNGFRLLGFSFLAMPIGYLAINEIANISVGSILGLKALGIFSILKSISGIFRQITGVFTLSVLPALSHLLSSGKVIDSDVLFFTMRRRVIAVNSLSFLILLFLYGYLESYFVEMKLIPFISYLLFMVCAYVDIWWLTDSTILVANNQHQGMSIRFLVSSLIGTSIGCLTIQIYGVVGMALGTLILDLVLTPYCARARNSILQRN